MHDLIHSDLHGEEERNMSLDAMDYKMDVYKAVRVGIVDVPTSSSLHVLVS